MIEPCIVAVLGGDPTVAGLVAARIRPLSAGLREVRPFLTYEVAGDEPVMTMSGASEFSTANVEIGIVGDTYAAVANLAGQIKRLLSGTSFKAASVQVVPSIMEEESDIGNALEPGTNKQVYVKTQSYRMLYRAAS